MQVYGRGLVRRLPPMLDGDPRRVRGRGGGRREGRIAPSSSGVGRSVEARRDRRSVRDRRLLERLTEVESFEHTRMRAREVGKDITVLGVDKFPRMTDYVVPPGVRIADADRVRLGAHLAEVIVTATRSRVSHVVEMWCSAR